MEYAIIMSPGVWIVVLLHAFVIPGTTLDCFRNWKGGAKGSGVQPIQVQAVPANGWRGASIITSGDHSTRNCKIDLMKFRKIKINASAKTSVGHCNKSTVAVAGTVLSACEEN